MGKTVTLILAFASLLPFVAGTATGTTLSIQLDHDPSLVRFEERGGERVAVAVEGYRHTNFLDLPSLPYRVVAVLLPQGEMVSSYRARIVERIELDASVELARFDGDYRDDGAKIGMHIDRTKVVGPDAVFPRWRVRHLGSHFLKGYRIAAFAVYPFRYNVDSGLLELDSELELLIETEPETVPLDYLERKRHVDGFRDENRRLVESIVVNPYEVARYTFNDIVVDRNDTGFLPSYFPSMEGSEVAYLIVTNEDMAPAFETLADWKTRKGIPAVVRTIEWIGQNYRSGADLGESVRIFIQEAFAKWGVEWVVLGGDTDIIPARFCYVDFYGGELIPTDMYYSCLDGNWNNDGDSLWGEAYHTAQDPGDMTDMYSEVYVGRITVSTHSEAELLVNKTISYAAPVDTSSKEKFLFLAEVLYPEIYIPGGDLYMDGAEFAQEIYELYLEFNINVVTSRLYETCALYPGSICLTKEASLDSLSAGTNHVVHVGHGSRYNMSVGNGTILNYDADNLSNGDALYTMYLMNCTNVAFDTDCLAEHFLLNDQGGAMAVTGSSRSAFPSISKPYMDEYFELLFDHDIVQLGKLHVNSRLPFTPLSFGENVDRWTHFIYNFLGDPELNVFQQQAKVFAVTVPATADFGPNSITVQVQSDGSPYDSARVCLYKEGDNYAFDFTGPTGEVVFDDYLCKTGGYIYVTVTGRNHCRYTDSIQVLAEAGPYLRLEDKALYDDVVGNNDGVLDAGEWVTLFGKLHNTGQGNGEKLYAILRSDDLQVTVTDSTALYPDIPSGGKAWGHDGWRFSIDSGVGDEEAVEFTIEIHDSMGGFWSEPFAYEVHAPELTIYVSTKSDTLPYGNNNGIIEPGEDFLLQIGMRNYGTGAAYGLQGIITTSDIDLTITDSVSVYDEITPLGTGYGDGFVLSEANMTKINYYFFELTDAYGRTFSKQMELRRPGPPTGVVLNSSYGPTEIHVTWHPPDSLEQYRYQLYNATVQGGPYALTNGDPVWYTLFRDYELLTNTVYYYTVTALDSCGNEGLPSTEVSISTNPSQLPGWPNAVDRESSSSPKIADVDGDTYLDIVVGSEYIYAWHADGFELRDGDNRPVTLGIFNEYGDNFQSTVALADLDGVPGAEIIASSWNTSEIYVFNKDGDTLPNWPKNTIDFCWASPVIGDLDDDGDFEIVAYDVDGIVYAWHHDGTEVRDGDSNPATDGVFFLTDFAGSAPWHISTPALADFDGDGVVEILVVSPDTDSPGIQDSIYCLNVDGTNVLGWPVPLEDDNAIISASPAVGDIDDDGYLEMIVQSTAARIYGLNHDGTWMSGWPRWVYSNSTPAGSPALADLTGDGKLEVIVPGMDSYCYIFRYNGQPLQNHNPSYDWPQAYASSGVTESSPTIADIDNDGSFEIILCCESGVMNAWNIFGQAIPGFPIWVYSYMRGTPMVRDLDYDGDLELVGTAWDKNVYVWDLEGERYYGFAPWNGFHANVYNTGWLEFDGVTAVDDITWAYHLIGSMIELAWSVGRQEYSWDLYRQRSADSYELLRKGLSPDGTGRIQYIDRSVEEGLTYRYRLEAAGRPELFIETDHIEVPVATVRLYQNYPNPFNPVTSIPFTVPCRAGEKRNVFLAVYNVAGARVSTLVNTALPGGRHEARWNGVNSLGAPVTSGIYFVHLNVDGHRATRKIVLIR